MEKQSKEVFEEISFRKVTVILSKATNELFKQQRNKQDVSRTTNQLLIRVVTICSPITSTSHLNLVSTTISSMNCHRPLSFANNQPYLPY